jgi:polar amino acid transport system substrate-binding protein
LNGSTKGTWVKTPTERENNMSKNSTLSRLRAGIAAAAIVAFALTGCAAAETTETITAGKLTIGTGEPAYGPWVLNDDPESGEGFEAAVAYAVATELGYAAEDVVWVRTTFEEAIQPGPKNFDFNLQQYSITEERKANVDFSDPYYQTTQTVITVAGSKAEKVTDLAGLKGLLVGAATGTTSFTSIEEFIKPTAGAKVYNNNDDAKQALAAGQLDALVVDYPTAYFLTCCDLTDGKILGQISGAEGGDSFGLVLDKGSPLTAKVNAALKTLRDNGTLAELEKKWLTDTGSPILK